MSVSAKKYSPWIWIIVPAWLLVFLWLCPPHTLDVEISRLFFAPGEGWSPEYSVLLRALYRWDMWPAIAFALLTLLFLLYGLLIRRQPLSHPAVCRAAYILCAMGLCVTAVWLLKQQTGVYCPWSVSEFGGSQAITSPDFSVLFQPGRCWPGGHAGAGFCLLAFYFGFRDRCAGLSRAALLLALLIGVQCSLVRMMQGAHFFSHNVATLLIDWLICAGLYILFFDRGCFLRRLKNELGPLSVRAVVFRQALYWTLCLDIPFWVTWIDRSGLPRLSFLTVAASLAAFFCVACALLLALSLLPRTLFKVVLAALSVVGAAAWCAWYFYGAAMTPDMIRNFISTDTAEASGYLSWNLAIVFLWIFLPGLIGALRCERSVRFHFPVIRVAGVFGCTVLGAGLLLSQFQEFSALMRTQKDMRYLIAPVNVVYSTVSTLTKDENPDRQEKVPVDPAPAQTVKPAKPSLLVVMVGESARSASWQLAGYDRPTNPKLSARNDIISIGRMNACGTSTDVSLPCMFSRIGRRSYDRERIVSEESLPSLLQRAGFEVLWLDNQSGCKGVCTGVPTQKAEPEPRFCPNGRCLDDVLVTGIRRSLQSIRGNEQKVLFAHMIGSHGPAYWERSSDDEKVFGSVCRDPAFKGCSQAQIRAAYDASLRYTDKVLSEAIETLKAQDGVDTALIYISDHGESLGEKGLFLHGAPYYVAPDEQKVVPMLMWFSEGFRKDYAVNTKAIQDNAAFDVQHDHLFHTILGLLKVKSQAYEKRWDLSSEGTNRS